MQEKMNPKAEKVPGMPESDAPFRRKCRMTWAALIKCVFEVDPLQCPKCGGMMKAIGFIDEDQTIEKILRHCELWKDAPPRPPPVEPVPEAVQEPVLDYGFFDQTCI